MLSIRRLLAAVAAALPAAPLAGAEVVSFTIDQSASEIRVVGSSIDVLGFTIPGQPTQAGAWDAPLTGAVVADVTAADIQILPATGIVVVDDTLYLPGDLAAPGVATPGSLAVRFTVPFAGTVTAVTRGVAVSLTDAAARAIALDGSFDASAVAGQATAGVVDADVLGAPEQGDLTGSGLGSNAAPAGAFLAEAGGVQTLTLPLRYTLSIITTEGVLDVELEADVVATRDVPACAADINSDGVTDVFDFSDLAANFGAGPGATRAMGDVTGDGFVDVFDFAELAADFGCPG